MKSFLKLDITVTVLFRFFCPENRSKIVQNGNSNSSIGKRFSVPPFTWLCKGHLPFDEKLCLNFQKFLVMIVTEFSGNFFPEKRLTSQGIPKCSKISYLEFPFHLIPLIIFKWYHFRLVAFFGNSTFLLFSGKFPQGTGVPFGTI